MSALTLLTNAGARARRARAPQLRLLTPPAPSVASRGIFAGVIAALVVAGMGVLLLLNTSLAQGAFDLQSLQQTQSGLEVTAQALQQQIEAEESPDALQQRAGDLGMVPVPVPAFLRLSDGAVLGVPTAAPRSVTAAARAAKAAAATTGATRPSTATGAHTAPGGPPAVAGAEGAEVQAAPRQPASSDAASPVPSGAHPASDGAQPVGPTSDAAQPTSTPAGGTTR